ncbi:hypothetical protein NQ318_009212, partial [Aromia moschata]
NRSTPNKCRTARTGRACPWAPTQASQEWCPAAGLLGFGAGLAAGVPGAPRRTPSRRSAPGRTAAQTSGPALGEIRRRPQETGTPSLPGDRDKYRSRSPAEVEQVVKRRKDDKLGHVSDYTMTFGAIYFLFRSDHSYI